MVLWLGFSAFTAMASPKSCCEAKKSFFNKIKSCTQCHLKKIRMRKYMKQAICSETIQLYNVLNIVMEVFNGRR